MARSTVFSRTTAFRLYLKKTSTSTAMVQYLPFGSKTVMSISGNDTCTPIASRQKQKPESHCWGDTETHTPTTKW
jgi:hypothetical protein